MRTSVRRWGNSLALRIPKSLAEDAAIGLGTEVEVRVEDGRLVVTPVGRRRYTLAALLTRVTEENRHHEVDAGGPVGREAW